MFSTIASIAATALLLLSGTTYGASIPSHISLHSLQFSSPDRILVGTHWSADRQEVALRSGASALIYEVQIPVIAILPTDLESSITPKQRPKRWNNEYFNGIETADPQSKDATQYDQWNYILPGCFMLSAMLGNMVFMVAGLALVVLCWNVAQYVAAVKVRRKGNVVEKQLSSGESTEDMAGMVELESRSYVALSEREMQALRNWEEGLPSWAMD